MVSICQSISSFIHSIPVFLYLILCSTAGVPPNQRRGDPLLTACVKPVVCQNGKLLVRTRDGERQILPIVEAVRVVVAANGASGRVEPAALVDSGLNLRATVAIAAASHSRSLARANDSAVAASRGGKGCQGQDKGGLEAEHDSSLWGFGFLSWEHPATRTNDQQLCERMNIGRKRKRNRS